MKDWQLESDRKALQMLEGFKKHLESLTPEEFAAEWAEIEAMGCVGPDAGEYCKMLQASIEEEENKSI